MSDMITSNDETYSIKSREWHGKANLVEEITPELIARITPEIFEGECYTRVPELQMFGGVLVPTGRMIELADSTSKTLVADYRRCNPELSARMGGLITLHRPKQGYNVIPNNEVFQLVKDSTKDALGNDATITTAGTLRGGREFYICVDLANGEYLIKRRDGTLDASRQFLSFLTSHDGKLGLRPIFASIRPVCKNTVNAILSTGAAACETAYHTANYKAKVAKMAAAIALQVSGKDILRDKLQELADMPASHETMRQIALGYYAQENGKEKGEEVSLSSRSINSAEEVVRLAKVGRGNQGDSLYDLFNGFTEYYSTGDGTGKGKGATDESRWQKSQFGAAMEHKENVLKVLTDADKRAELEWIGATVEKVILREKVILNA